MEDAVTKRKGTVGGQRDVSLDLLRIIGCLMVIFNHTNERGFYRFATDDPGSASFFLDLTMSTICKAGVPLFFMISGSLLLRRTEEPFGKIARRMLRIFIDLVLFTILYFWTDALATGTPFSWEATIRTMVGSNYWHLWYLYAYLVFLLSLPILRKFMVGLDEKTSGYLFLLAFLYMGFFPVLAELSPVGINDNLELSWLIENVFIYPVAGYILDRKLSEGWFTKKRIGLLWLVNLACFVVGEAIAYWSFLRAAGQEGSEGYFDERFLINFCLVNATALYVTARYFTKRVQIPALAAKIISEIGVDTFGIYLLHIWFLWKIPPLFAFWSRIEHTGVFGYHFGILVSCLLTFVLAGAVTFVLRRVPIVKKLF